MAVMITIPTVRGCVLNIYILMVIFESYRLWQCNKFSSPLTFPAIWYVTE